MKYISEKLLCEFNRLAMAGKSAGVVAGSYAAFRGGKWYLNRRAAKKAAIQNSQNNEQQPVKSE